MKFLVDAQLPPALCRWLRDRGHDADYVSGIGMIAASYIIFVTAEFPSQACSNH
ncbi:DUF5615 family PIN-like protein [Sphingobium lactosutens]|uniref:DUF5615 family PIN-like protein n=1 Tax=Sphingobium lactosutens TaxID=522773 RepID=UPI0015C1B46C